ncbi:MAG: HAD hydrolase-like protein [Mycobacterium sp.]
MHVTSEQVRLTRPARTFWWDRARPVDADVSPLRAVIFDADALAGIDGDGDILPRAGLVDLMMSLFVAGVWVGVVSPRHRECVQPLVRQLVGDGLFETIVSADDVTRPEDDTELYRLVLWELGITAEDALAVAGSARGCRAAAAAGLPVLAVAAIPGVSADTGADARADPEFTATAAVRADYEGLLVDDCRRLRSRWWIANMCCNVGGP